MERHKTNETALAKAGLKTPARLIGTPGVGEKKALHQKKLPEQTYLPVDFKAAAKALSSKGSREAPAPILSGASCAMPENAGGLSSASSAQTQK